jgi:hypothetical protein
MESIKNHTETLPSEFKISREKLMKSIKDSYKIRSHPRFMSQQNSSDTLNNSDCLLSNNKVQSKPYVALNFKQNDQINQTDQIEQIKQTDQINQNELEQINQTDQTKQTNQIEQTDILNNSHDFLFESIRSHPQNPQKTHLYSKPAKYNSIAHIEIGWLWKWFNIENPDQKQPINNSSDSDSDYDSY